MARARAHTLDACLRSESLIKHFTDSTILPSPPAWLFGPHHSPQSKPVFIKLLWNVGKADTEEVGVYLGGAKYFIVLSIAHCDWVVYAVNAGDKPMGHWLLVVALSIAHCDWVVYAVNAGDKPMGHWLLVVPVKICRPLQCVGPPGKCPVCPITSPALTTVTSCSHSAHNSSALTPDFSQPGTGELSVNT